MGRGGGFRPINNNNNGGGGRGRGGGGDRRRSRSPPGQKNNNNNNNNNSNNNSGGPSAPDNSAAPAPAFTFEMRRLVTAAFSRFPTELAAASITKDSVLPLVFKATDDATYFDPSNGGSKETALAGLSTRLEELMKSKEISDWMMEKASSFLEPQPKKMNNNNNNNRQNTNNNRFEQKQQNNNNGSTAAENQQQQQAPPPYNGSMMMNNFSNMNNNNNHNNFQQQQNQQGGFGFNNRFNNNNNRQQNQQPLALLPDPSDPKIVVVQNLPDDINNEQNVRITINNRANNSIVKTVLCENDKNRAIVFCFDDTQALALRLFPPGTVFVRAPDARIVECDAATWKHALTVLRNKVVEKENLAMEEIIQITSEEEGLSVDEVYNKLGKKKPTAAAAATSTSTAAVVVSEEQQAIDAAKKSVAELQSQRDEISAGLEKFKKELGLLEALGDAIAGLASQAARKNVVQEEVKNRTASLEEVDAKLEEAKSALGKLVKQEQQPSENDATSENDNNNDQQQQQEGRREKQISSSTGQIGNPKALLFFSGFSSEGNNQFNVKQVNQETGMEEDKGWSNAKILAILKHLPNIQPLHIWRSPKNTDICVEVVGGPPAVTNVANFLSFNDFVFCGIRVTRTRPQQ